MKRVKNGNQRETSGRFFEESFLQWMSLRVQFVLHPESEEIEVERKANVIRNPSLRLFINLWVQPNRHFAGRLRV